MNDIDFYKPVDSSGDGSLENQLLQTTTPSSSKKLTEVFNNHSPATVNGNLSTNKTLQGRQIFNIPTKQSYVPKRTWRSTLLYFISLSIYYFYAQRVDKKQQETELKNYQNSMEASANNFVSDLKNNLNDKEFTDYIRQNLTSEFRTLLLNKIFAEVAKPENNQYIQKCWEFIPCDSHTIQDFMDVLKKNGIVNQGGGKNTLLQTAVELHRWDLIKKLIEIEVFPDFKNEMNLSPIEILLNNTKDLSTIHNALVAIYGDTWKTNEKIAGILSNQISIVELIRLYEGEGTWKPNEKIVSIFLEKFVSELGKNLNDKDFTDYIRQNSTSRFRTLLLNKIFAEVAKPENNQYIQKCWEFIPCDSHIIQDFMDVLKKNGIVNQGGGNNTILQTAVKLHRWDLVQYLIANKFSPDFKNNEGTLPIQIVVQNTAKSSTIIKALEAYYGDTWKTNEDVAHILKDVISIGELRQLYGDGNIWKPTEPIALIFLEKFPQAAKDLNFSLEENREFWSQLLFQKSLQKKVSFKDLPDQIKNNNNFLIDIVEKETSLIGSLPSTVINNHDFWIEVFKRNSSISNFLPVDKRDSKSFWINVLIQSSECAKFLPEQFNNVEFWCDSKLWYTSKEKHNQLIENVPIAIRELEEFKKTLAALKIQKKFRDNRVKIKLKRISPEEIEIQKQRQYSVPITTRIRQPLEDLSRHFENFSGSDQLVQAQQALAKAAKLGTYEKFNLALRSSFIDTLETIFLSPSDERKYVIIADENGKSTNWAIAHLQDIMAAHPPTDIISRNNLEQFLRDNPDVHHVVMVDDGSYSGEQASRYLGKIEVLKKEHHFHVTIPYMTNFGKRNIIAALQEKRCDYFMHDKQMMLSYKELYKMRIFAHTGKVIINFDEIKKISSLNDPGLSDEIIVSVYRTLFKNVLSGHTKAPAIKRSQVA